MNTEVITVEIDEEIVTEWQGHAQTMKKFIIKQNKK